MGVELLNIDLKKVSEYIASNKGLWQLDFFDLKKFSRFVHERGCGFVEGHIEQLWKLKLLRADLIKSKVELNINGIERVERDKYGQYIYYDNRKPQTIPHGWGDAINSIDNNNIELSPFFHPFRIYSLYYLDRLTDHIPIPKHLLISTKWHRKTLDDNLDWFAKYTSNTDFIKRVQYFDEITTLSILLEPWNYYLISGAIKWPHYLTAVEQKKRLDKHKRFVNQYCDKITEKQIFNIRQQLCTRAEMLEPNKNIHTLVRFAISKYILQLKGNLGGAIILLLMAEIIRITYEDIFKKELKEEDEMGFGVMPTDLKKRLYGNNRLRDGDKNAEKNYIAQLGFDYSTKIKFYLEGYTEYGAIKLLFGQHTAFEFINLSGEFIEKRRKGLSFKENLRIDIDKGVFSVVFLDGDNTDNLKLLKDAATKNEFFGYWFVSQPDFEMNFSIIELVNASFLMLEDDKNSITLNKDELLKKIDSINNGKEFFNKINDYPELKKCKKGEKWGQALIRLIEKLDDRPLFQFIRDLVYVLRDEYQYYRTNYKVDINTGRLALNR